MLYASTHALCAEMGRARARRGERPPEQPPGAKRLDLLHPLPVGRTPLEQPPEALLNTRRW